MKGNTKEIEEAYELEIMNFDGTDEDTFQETLDALAASKNEFKERLKDDKVVDRLWQIFQGED